MATEPDAQIVDIDVSAEMESSFLEYAYSVIYSRALPDARDGLKPVQRRIVYTMGDMGLRPDRAHVKSSRVVGEVMGKYHPHGDSAIYDALVRMAQSFSLRLPLVDGHGNFGSLDDGPAASRYTEARLAPGAMAMIADLGEDVVEFVPNYDNKLQQPSVLPAAVPALLVNGASGIAVGMATNMAPHNLIEVISAAKHLLHHPQATLDELMRFVPGPDLPGGGKIVGLDGIKQAYETGRGAFKTRATTKIEKVTPRRQGIVVTELPYLVGPEKVIEKIKDGVSARKLEGISAVTDLTDRHHGTRLVIEIKNGFNPEAVLERLYKVTPLEESFSMNNVALVDGQPRTLGLKELLKVWVDHRLDVVRRRSSFRLAARKDRLHLVDGLLIAILDIDDVIQIIRTSDDAASAKQRLMTAFDLSEIQSEYILELRLRRLTKFSRLELENEKAQLLAEIAELEEILASDRVLRDVVGREMDVAASEHGTPRRTILLADAGAPAVSAAVGSAPSSKTPALSMEIEDTPCFALLSATGLIARTSDDSDIAREGRRSAHDVLRALIPASARADIGVITSTGRLHRLSLLDVPTLAPSAEPPSLGGGVPISELLTLDKGEDVVTIVPLGSESPLALGTAHGVVKRVTPGDEPSKEVWEVIGLKDGDTVVGAGIASDESEMVFVSTTAQLLHFSAAGVRPQGRAGGGIAGINLGDGASVLFFGVLAPDAPEPMVVTISGPSSALPGTTPGSAKVTPFTEYPGKGRATGGVRAHRFLKGEDALLLAYVGPSPARATSGAGQAVDLPEEHGRRDGSGTPLAAPVLGIG
ncbi:DNA gyrase/topoisomerase IV subunit A [Demequina zhanjiangensis]|uniref:DNA topoisomerase (ATP-hydrolyzing) n=1 Tax=Demequina zhanjiangensis TaxID=3051659 RepID=A0ABT8G1X9_9MICO|nr:DNA topoisomerase IV subunit A [Demequina sp. SYSU T00b26]MDN4472714.1 DNA topoisomerase IV subunit A [Demequina sp. SYSU T00b26]